MKTNGKLNVRALNVEALKENGSGAVGDPEVPEKPIRRTFTAAYKLQVLREVDASPGEVGAILRREGLYSSHLTTWRRQRQKGELEGLTPQRRGRKAKVRHPLERRVTELEREKHKLERELKQAKLIIEIQKKVSEILGIPLNSPALDDDD